MRVTDRSGRITPIEIPVPELSAGQTPDTGEMPYALVNLTARKQGYLQLDIKNLQIFPDTTTNQNLELIPHSELPSQWSRKETVDTGYQPL